MTANSDLSVEELMMRHRQYQEEERQRELAAHADLILDFTLFARSKGIILSECNFDYIQTIGIVAQAPRLLTALLTDLQPDRDGLLSFEELAKLCTPDLFQSGYLKSPRFIAMAHPHFRRSFYEGNNFAPRFLDLFWAYKNSAVTRYLALDEHRVRVDIDGPGYMEADTWFGAPFNQDVSLISDGIVKLRPPLDLKETYNSFFFANAYSLDIKWASKENIKTFQSIEFKSESVHAKLATETYFPARYLHAEFDVELGVFRHFDGAVQYYTEDEYFKRRDSDFNFNLKSGHQIKSKSKKLFKLNGQIDVNDWVELSCHFFAANPLTHEYFSGRYPENIVDALEKIKNL